MNERKSLRFKVVVLGFVLLLLGFSLNAIERSKNPDFTDIGKKILELMEEVNIPGLSLVIVKGNEPAYIKGFGYADMEKKVPVTPDTLFELGPCSKAFTALAALKLERFGQIHLDDPVSKYLYRFYVNYEGKPCDITLRQLLHHTSGIPFKSIDKIPESNSSDALEQTVKNLIGIELNHLPGIRFEYATVNYDIIGLVIENASCMSYEDYMMKHIIQPLGLTDTSVGKGINRPMISTGFKIGFFKPREYDAPVYRGNNPAGYIVSNGKDMARWLKWQMGLIEKEKRSDFYSSIQKSHERDKSVIPNLVDFSSYAMGWRAYVDGSDIIDHSGLNPNFSAYVGFSRKDKVGVAVLANSNSSYTPDIGRFVMNYARGKGTEIHHIQGNTFDKTCSIISIILAFYLLCSVAFLLSIGYDVIKRRRRFEGFGLVKFAKLLRTLLILAPFLIGISLIPKAMSNVSWDTAIVWSPVSFQAALVLLLTALGMSYVGYFFSSLFPWKNKYLRSTPLLIVLSLLSGGANAMVIFLVSSALFSNIELVYQLYYFALSFFLYILGRKVLQTKLMRVSIDIIHDLRVRMVEKVFLTSYQKFENLDRGRVYATLNDDIFELGQSANIIAQLIIWVVTIVGVFVYLSIITFWATVVTILVVVAMVILYGIASRKTRGYFEDARDTRNVYMGLLNGLLNGFKELSLQMNKKREYKDDIENTSDIFRKKISRAILKFINASIIGESMLIVVLGAVAFAIPRIFPDISTFTLMSFIIIILYLIGPINGILNSIPTVVRIFVCWNRVKTFEQDIPANIDVKRLKEFQPRPKSVEKIEAKDVVFEYESENEEERFKVGPLDFNTKKGEITFIIGDNGSGKTTLAKLLTGLYIPHQGKIEIESNCKKTVDTDGSLGEYFSAVFEDSHLFSKLYNVNLEGREKEVQNNIETLWLKDKVNVEDNAFSTLGLSSGQRKRLALLRCYLENSPIYLFDEVAADQDPQFRKFFYRNLLVRMKKRGKIVIAITRDEHYFDVADKVIKMDMGKIETVVNLKESIDKRDKERQYLG